MSRKYRFKTEPYPHQVRALKKAVKNKALGLFIPMRGGKTKVAIDWAGCIHLKYGVRRVLVITHTPTTIGVWRQEFKKHCPLDFTVGINEQPPAGDGLEICIINIQRVFDRERVGRSWEPRDAKWIYAWGPEAIIVDESTTIGDPASLQSRKVYLIQKRLGIPYKLILSGTPLHRKLFMAFGQFKFLDDGIFGTDFGAFKRTYGVWGGYAGRVLIKYINITRFRRKIEPHIFQMVHVPTRKPVHQVIPVELPEKVRSQYNQFMIDRVLPLAGSQVDGELLITRLVKAASMCSGWVRTSDDQWHYISPHKSLALNDRLADYVAADKKKIIIFTRWIKTIPQIQAACRKAGYKTLLLHGGINDPLERERRYVRFNEAGGKWAFISQVSAGSMGIDLSAADTTLYYSLPGSLLHYDQSMARQRKFRDTRLLSYDYLITKHSIEEIQLLALQSGMDFVDFVMKHPSLIHHQDAG